MCESAVPTIWGPTRVTVVVHAPIQSNEGSCCYYMGWLVEVMVMLPDNSKQFYDCRFGWGRVKKIPSIDLITVYYIYSIWVELPWWQGLDDVGHLYSFACFRHFDGIQHLVRYIRDFRKSEFPNHYQTDDGKATLQPNYDVSELCHLFCSFQSPFHSHVSSLSSGN